MGTEMNDNKEADALCHGGNPDSFPCWPLCMLGQLKIVQVSTIEANLCRWDVCSAAVVAAGMNLVSGHFNRACKPLLHKQSLPEMSTPNSFLLDCLFFSSQSVTQSFCTLIHISVHLYRGKWSCLATSLHTASFLPVSAPSKNIFPVCIPFSLISSQAYSHII